MLSAAERSMGRKKKKTINLTKLEPEEKLKYEIAEELGLLDRVMQDGWKSLTSKETGRIGGMVTGRRREIKKQTNADVIAVAHHQDDSVETVLLNFIRGTGINGLLGIRPKNGDIARPLLCIDRKEIIDYLQSTGQQYVTDSTNLQDNTSEPVATYAGN